MSLAQLLEETRLVELADDTGINMPEHPETLEAQQRALREGRQRVQMFPRGTPELPLPAGMARMETPRGVFHFDPKEISANEIRAASAAGRENEILGLGPASKVDVAKRVARGEPVFAVVESTPDGREVKAAFETPSTAPAAAAEMERRRAPENRIQVQPVEKVIAGRVTDQTAGWLARLLAETGTEPASTRSAEQSRPAAIDAWDNASAPADSINALAAHPVEVLGELAVRDGQDKSSAAEYGATLADELQRSGVDFRQSATLATVISNPAQLARVKEAAQARGVPGHVLDELATRVVRKMATAATQSPPGGIASTGEPTGATASGGGLARLLAETGDEQAKTPGFFGGVANSAKRGLTQAGQAIDAASLVAGANLAADAASEPDRVAAERLGDPPPNPKNWQPGGPGIGGQHGYEVALQKWQTREAEREERLKNNARFVDAERSQVLPALGAAVGRRQQEIEALPRSEAMKAWDSAPDTGTALRVLAAHPLDVIANLAAQGLTSGAPSLALGAAGSVAGPLGTMGGAGLGSLASEYGGKIVAELQAAGVDFDRPETLAQVLNDPTRLAQIRDKALRRGVPVAVLDAISAGVAGRLVTSPARTLTQRAAHGATEMGVQAALGGAGEVAGSVAAGEPVSGKAVAEEMLGQLGSGAAQIVTGAARERALGHAAPAENARPASGLARLIAETSDADAASSRYTSSARAAALQSEESASEVFGQPLGKKPPLGKPAEAVAAAINARPAEHFKPDLTRIEGADVDLISQLARYGEATRQTDEDFPTFAERMTTKFGDKVQSYLPFAWDAVSGDRPVRDLVPTENPLQLEAAWKRAAQWGRLFFEGSADVLRRAGVNSLADAIERHVDYGERNLAEAWSFVKPTLERFQGVGGLVNRGRAARVMDEFEAFYRARENGRTEDAQKILDTALPDTRRLIGGVRQMFIYTGQENRRLGVRVRDAEGRLRPIGYLGADNFPRMLKDDVRAVLRDPSSDPARWEEMKAELVKNGNVQTREEAAKFARGAATDETSNDYFGSLEKARADRFPESWYEYRAEKVIPRYVAEWAERTAQIEAFGQKIAETDRDAFDVAADAVHNPELRRYIEATREHAYRVNRMNPTARRVIGNLTSATTALFLGNPYSTLRNLIGGAAQSVNQYGVVRAAAALRDAWQSIPDAEAMGAVKADVADMLFHDDGSPATRKLAGAALRMAGFNAAEQFVRAHGWLTAKTFLRDAVRSIEADPESRRSTQGMAFFRRHGFDPAKLVQENLRGPETERFLRGSVREAQGSYKYGQVPLFTDGPLGRFLLQFARWGTQATRFHAKHIIAPAIFGDRVPVRDAGGKVQMRRVRTLLPLLRSPVVAMAAGATTFALRDALFGYGRADATWDEVWKTMDEDQQRAFELGLGHMVNDVIMGGTFGALSDYSAMLRDAAQRSRFKNPIEPPAASIIKEVGVLAYKKAQQGQLSAQDYREFASRVVTAYRYGSALAYRFGDAVGAEWAAARRFQAERDKTFIRNISRRFGEEMGYDMPGATGGLPNVTENSPFYDALEDALLAGDSAEARRLIAQRMAGAHTADERAERFRQLRTSALGRQPLKPGGQSGSEDRQAFRAWARRRLPPEDVRRIYDAQRQYFDAGRRAGLFTDADVNRYTAR